MERLATIWALTGALLVALSAGPLDAASIDCADVDESATTYFPDTDTSSTTTSNKKCTVSIAGVNASGAWPAATANCISTLGAAGFSAVGDSRFFGEIAVPYIASLSVPDLDLPRIGMPESRDVALCLDWAERAVGDGAGGELTDLFDLDEEEVITISNCVVENSDGGGDISCEQREMQILIGFPSPFGDHTVSLPRR